MKSRTDRLVELFASCSLEADARLAKLDVPGANRATRRGASAFKKLCAMGDAGRDALMVLLDDPRPRVRLDAAAVLLRHAHEKARCTLEEIGGGSQPYAFEASQCLLRWEEGTWHLDDEK
jgi:hypothetical protein